MENDSNNEITDLVEFQRVNQYFDEYLPDSVNPRKLNENILYELDELYSSPPIINIVNRILLKVVQEGVQEVRLIPLKNTISTRFNQGKGFYDGIGRMPSGIVHSLVNRIRLMANMTLLARNKPVSGKMRLIYQDKTLDFIVHILPSTYGQSLYLFLDVELKQFS
jgi:type II secretory ATPase GspE/PulE/Tfp pilus assembly ATPase PilB-like protein